MPYKRGRKGKQGRGAGRSITPTAPAPAAAEPIVDPSHTPAPAQPPSPPPSLEGDAHTSTADELILTSEKRRGVYECDYCHNDISQVPRIRCAVCADFDLCLECFITTDHAAASARLRAALATQKALQDEGTVVTQTTVATAAALNHDDTHGYRVCDNTRYPVFPTARHVAQHKGSAFSEMASNDSIGGTMGGAKDDDSDPDPDADNDTANTMDTIDDQKSDRSTKETSGADASTHSSVMTTSTTKPLDDLAIAVLTDDPKLVWTVEEDLRLIEGIRCHGLGNWAEISDVVNGHGSSGKTPRRCMERYFDDFLGRYGLILPPFTLIMEDAENTEDGCAQTTSNATNDESDAGSSSTKPSSELMDGTPRSSKRRAVLMRSPSGYNAGGWTQRKRFRCVPTESIPGYEDFWPKPHLPHGVTAGTEVGRDSAYKAEQTYVRLTQAASTPEEAEKIYQEWKETKLDKPGGPTVLPPRLDDIISMPGSELVGFMPRRGDFDMEWENEAEQAVADMEFLPNEPPEDRKLKLQVLQIYNSKLDEREKRKQFIITRKLWDYKKAYNIETNLPRDERDLVNRMRLFERFHTPAEHKVFLEDILKAKRLRKEIAKLQMYRRMGMKSLAEAEKYELDKQRRVFHGRQVQQQQQTSKEDGGKKDDATSDRAARPAEETTSMSLWKQYRTGERRNRKSINRGVTPPTGETEAATAGSETASPEANKAIEGPSQDIDSPQKESISSLSATEQELCDKLDLTEDQYKEIKKALISQSLAHGLLDKESIGSQKRSVVKMDAEREGQVINFMLRAGWVSPKAATVMRQSSINSLAK